PSATESADQPRHARDREYRAARAEQSALNIAALETANLCQNEVAEKSVAAICHPVATERLHFVLGSDINPSLTPRKQTSQAHGSVTSAVVHEWRCKVRRGRAGCPICHVNL